MRGQVWIAVAPMALLALVGLAAPLHLGEAASAAALHALDVLESGNWILPLEGGVRGAPNPPLLAWLQAAVGLVFGAGGLALRLPSALAAVGLAWLAYQLAEEQVGEGAGLPAAWMLAACPLLAAQVVSPTPDVLLAAAVNLALLGLLRACAGGGERGAAAFYVGLAAAFLSKGPVGVLLIVASCAAVAFSGAGRRALRGLAVSTWSGVLAVPILWAALAYVVGESIHLDEAMGVFADAVRGQGAFADAPHRLAPVSLLSAGAPWSWLGLAGAAVAFGRAGTPRRLAAVLLALLVCLSLSRTQRWVYVLPLLPLTCALAASLLADVATSGRALRRLRAAVCLGAGGLLAFQVAQFDRSDPDAALRALAGTVRRAQADGALLALYGPVPDAFRFYARLNVPARSDPELGWFFARARTDRPALLVTTHERAMELREGFAPVLEAWSPAGEGGPLAVLEARPVVPGRAP